MIELIEVARSKGLDSMEGEVLANNRNMLKLVATLGFTITSSEEDRTVMKLSKPLR